jgi:acetate---CoA ligase (ADP-forming)
MNYEALFRPKNVAVIGASAQPGKLGNTVVANMIAAGYKGDIYPVNPKGDEILGLKVIHNIADLPKPLDMAVITVPRDHVLPALKELVGRKVKSAIVITAGFKEVGKEGYTLETEMTELAKKHDIALIGPNCLGLIATGAGVNASFAAGYPQKGNIAFFSQSGALCVAILDWALGENIGFSKFVSLGNKAVIDESHMLDYLLDDPETKVILGYIENVEHGKNFMRMARRITREKPVIMIKSGSTAAGAKAASSHTGAIAGSDNAYSAAFAQTGVIRVPDVSTLFDLAQAFSTQPLPKGPRLAIITNSGGPGILAADACEKSVLNLARPSMETIEQLQSFLPAYASLYNPIDIIGDAPADRYDKTIEVVLKDPMVNSVLVLLTPTASAEIDKTAEAIIKHAKTTDKPVFACFMGKMRIASGQKLLQDAGIPCYLFPEPAIESIATMYLHYLWKNKPSPVMASVEARVEMVRKVVNECRASGLSEIVEFQAQNILKAYDLPASATALARTSDEAAAAATEIGFPVVLKIASPHISHKSDVGGVKVGLIDAEAVRQAFIEVTNRARNMRPDAHITGCLIQAMAPKGCKEVIVGFKRDDQFGPLLMFGLGGIYVEVLKDITFRLAPLSIADAREMIREIKSYLLLKGVRGEAPVNLDALEDVIIRMSQLALDFPEIYEAECNPVLVNNEKAIVADMRLMLLPE